jgi:peptidoglycan/LPS O-acetylase OafA/YrhL
MIHDNADAIRTSVTDHSFLPSLTSMRAAAAVAVAIHHTRTAWAHFPLVDFFCQVGWLGVSYFFILSGFVLMRQFDRAASYRTFISKRLARIYPLHLLTLVASLLAFAIIGSPLAGYVGTPLGTVANFLLIHGWIPGHPDIRQAWNGVSWTLSCEFFFYLLAPALFLALDRRRYDVSLMWLFASLFILAFGLSLIGSIRGWNWFLDVLIYHPAPRMFEFALGAYGALLLKKGWTFHSQPCRWF